jgi:hypothetical protein
MFPPAPANHATAFEGSVLGFFGRERFAINARPKGFTGLDSLSIVSSYLTTTTSFRPPARPAVPASRTRLSRQIVLKSLAFWLHRSAVISVRS